MKYVHTFESFVFEAKLEKSDIDIKSKKDLLSMSIEELQAHRKEVDDYAETLIVKAREMTGAGKALTASGVPVDPTEKKEYIGTLDASDRVIRYLQLVGQITDERILTGDGDAKAAIDVLIVYLSGAIKDDNMSKSEATKWLKSKEGATAAEGALEAGEDDFGTVNWPAIQKEVTAKIMAMKDIFI